MPEDALKHVSAYFVTIDFTNRNLGAMFRKDGAPWCLYKSSDNFTAISDFIDVSQIKDPQNVRLALTVGDEKRQDFNTSAMIHRIADQIAYLSKHMTLNEGDMILTGTGEGVAPVKVGDIIKTELFENDE